MIRHRWRLRLQRNSNLCPTPLTRRKEKRKSWQVLLCGSNQEYQVCEYIACKNSSPSPLPYRALLYCVPIILWYNTHNVHVYAEPSKPLIDSFVSQDPEMQFANQTSIYCRLRPGWPSPGYIVNDHIFWGHRIESIAMNVLPRWNITWNNGNFPFFILSYVWLAPSRSSSQNQVVGTTEMQFHVRCVLSCKEWYFSACANMPDNFVWCIYVHVILGLEYWCSFICND